MSGKLKTLYTIRETTCEKHLRCLSSEFKANWAMKYGLPKNGSYQQAKRTRLSPKVTLQTTSKPTGASSIATFCETRADRKPEKTPHVYFF